ncbi:bifunctional UDP-N-acetylmuramoyl-tripeptide:D-alanyl-D-alanine ligase/alanine racemase [Flavobacterium sp. NST-5]|uniref:Alanine racemase n=1 Tax=Flavobacterium ichthyis TaxID=2698827 RepID=A0ABW9Z5C9_9FLAO|nr:bifunctional UDP-N-acetylmuramoyl-tripeptide:D-alanyl-D-alanine ligase/alanine racemase [Flavobacterium ichthyis]NBL63901.1 bifunctional UDP-N-acetylmuramoyl-tripeptide:D-alanyl-D-alanine ligase/alanine racemase [Flavobacterium ichthyis]
MSLKIHLIISEIDAVFYGNPNAEIDNVSIDSRSLQNNSGTLFFALIGTNNDAHQFIESLINIGVKNFVVERIPENLQGIANFFVVKNSLKALQKFASFYRKLFHFPVIGVTGSNGKTIVKEWLNFLLSPEYNIIRSPKSYNSQIGVPLSVIAINEKHNLGIFEAGISTVNEMDTLEKIIQPTIGILTTVGSAHDEGFQNTSEKIKEKLLLFKNVEALIYRKNDLVDGILDQKTKTFSWSDVDENADVFLSKKIKPKETELQVRYQQKIFSVHLPFQDEASIENAVSCLVTLLYLGYAEEVIAARVGKLYAVEMRLKVKNGINNTTLIDDSYSSDYQSLKIALDFLEQQKQHRKKTIILSDIFQSGLTTEALYDKVSNLIISNKIDRMIGVGTEISKYSDRFQNIKTYLTTQDFLADFQNLHFENETILIKGARSFQFEKLMPFLEEKTHETVLEINLNAISHNLNYFKSKLKPNTKLMVMVKAFGYGSGGFEIANLLEYHKVDYLGVAFADEGISLRSSGIKMPIMVLNPENSSFQSIIEYNLEPEIYSTKGLQSFLQIANQRKLHHYPIHIKLDTGMHRLGFQEDDLPELINILKNTPSIKVQSILSHLATSDDLEHREFAEYQIRLFEKLSSLMIKSLAISPIRHILNTSGISNFAEAQYDMVRLGIGLYGVSNDTLETKYLENVGTLKSIISQIRTIAAGESVGYGRRFVAESSTKIATIPIGYADGIPRSWGNEIGFVMIRNQKATILGSICMDMLMVNVTDIDCVEGDTVVIFGDNPTVSFIADSLNTIPYEILTGVSQRVKRIFFRE